MPNKIVHPCNHVGCPALTTERYCPAHNQAERQRYDQERGTAHERGYTARWQKARKTFLAANPLCAECERQDRVVAATVVDHIQPHKGDMVLFWDVKNWQPLCKECHDKKTAREDGGFGHP